jgi:phosphatidylserine decarboxylase
MRIPLTPHGAREIALFGGGALLAAALLFLLHPAASLPFVALAAFVLSFFRDPERKAPPGEESAVSPADGTVTDIVEVDEPHFLGGRALRIGIFLSVFNVHVNRAPLAGRVRLVRYSPGRFLDARDARCATENESNLVGFEGARGPFAVRQVAGLIARRIVCPVKQGDEVARGQRTGMIKFGSRTELLVPAGSRVKVETAVGRKVKGGETILLRYEP